MWVADAPSPEHALTPAAGRRAHSAGELGPNSTTAGVSSAVARCATPVSPQSTRPAAAITRASAPRSVRPASTQAAGSPALAATSWASAASAAEPVTTTGRPRRCSALATVAKRSAGQRRAALAAPGWTTVAPAASAGSGPGGGTSPSAPGSAGTPCSLSIRHQRSISCSPGRQRGAPVLSETARCANQSQRSRPASASSSRRWLQGPRPWRLTAISAPCSSGGSGWSSSAWTRTRPGSIEPTSGRSAAGAASTRRWRGNARASARSAGAAVSRSPRPSARSATSSGRRGGGDPPTATTSRPRA